MKKITHVVVSFLVLGIAAVAYAQVSISPNLLPSARNGDWNPGMRSLGGIPNRQTV